jgi:hypothetical protein
MSNGESAGVALYCIGAVGFAIGPEMLVAGAVLNKIGGNKQKEYKRRLHVNVGLNAISFTYLF